MSEYYINHHYAKKADGLEFYAKDKNKREIYLKIGDYEIFAHKFDENNEFVPYFALDENDIPIAPLTQDGTISGLNYFKNAVNKELYPIRNGKEYYVSPNNSGKFEYALDEKGTPYFASINGRPYYAFLKTEKDQWIEYPITDSNNKERYIIFNDEYIYPINITTCQPIYPKTKEGDEFYLEFNDIENYGRSNLQLPFYAKKRTRDEYFALHAKKPYYASFQKRQYYPRSSENHQFYLQSDNKETYAKSDDSEYYAQKENAEFLAKNDMGEQFYATSNQNIEIFPKNQNSHEYYRLEANVEKCALDKNNQISFYGKDFDKNEIYPKNFNPVEIEEEQIVLNVEPTEEDILNHLA